MSIMVVRSEAAGCSSCDRRSQTASDAVGGSSIAALEIVPDPKDAHSMLEADARCFATFDCLVAMVASIDARNRAPPPAVRPRTPVSILRKMQPTDQASAGYE